MKINVALFITALTTGRVSPVVSAAAAAGDDGAAAAATVDRPHLRALLQTNKLMACPGFLDSRDSDDASISCAGTPNYCDPCGNDSSTNQFSNCYQDTNFENDVAYFVKGCCTNSNNDNNCFGKNKEEDSMFIKADKEEEEEIPQDTSTTTDKLGDEIEAVVPSSSTLRASSLLKDNVFAKKDGVGAEDLLQNDCPPAQENQPSDPCGDYADTPLDCSNCPGKTLCTSGDNNEGSEVSGMGGWWAKCCNPHSNHCNDLSAQADEEDAVSLLKVE